MKEEYGVKGKMKRFQFSKVLALISAAILFLCLFWATSATIANGYDTAVVATVVGGAFTFALTTNVWYMKNSQAEKVANIKISVYRIASEEKLRYNKEMLLFMKENGFSQSDLDQVESDSPMDEFDAEALLSLNDSVNDAMNEATQSIQIQEV